MLDDQFSWKSSLIWIPSEKNLALQMVWEPSDGQLKVTTLDARQ